jgi:hypothetical protein
VLLSALVRQLLTARCDYRQRALSLPEESPTQAAMAEGAVQATWTLASSPHPGLLKFQTTTILLGGFVQIDYAAGALSLLTLLIRLPAA